MVKKGVVAAGHPLTANAAERVLHEGGNAFDAVVAAHFAACVAEPVLASLGGGGFLLAKTESGVLRLYDFFVHTPRRQFPVNESDFRPIYADFGTVTQEFHIGCGSIATPGTVRGLFDIHRDLCSMPMGELMAPAIELATNGVIINTFQSYIFEIVSPILRASPEVLALYQSDRQPGELRQAGEQMVQPTLANLLDALAREGPRLFYEGEVAQAIDRFCQDHGGSINLLDLAHYQTVYRDPLQINYRGKMLYTNPPPASGGSLIGFALQLLQAVEPTGFRPDSAEQLALLLEVMEQTNHARIEYELSKGRMSKLADLFEASILRDYQEKVVKRARAARGTTHISVLDAQGNVASMSMSNGEGCGYLVPGSGIMLNNMLGEQDLNSQGFHQWQVDQRMSSMMSPSLLWWPNAGWLALGSGGSNRIRSAILQVLIHLIDHGYTLEHSVTAPRVHLEQGQIDIEAGFSDQQMHWLRNHFPGHHCWMEHNLYFGGVHAVLHFDQLMQGAGDLRRGGVHLVVS